jgi:hypothetical protein
MRHREFGIALEGGLRIGQGISIEYQEFPQRAIEACDRRCVGCGLRYAKLVEK